MADSGQHGESRERRVARNEVFFRDGNELMMREAAERGSTASDVICECSALGCLERLTVSSDDYQRVRERGDRFLVAPGHEDPSVEVVVERHSAFYVVEKIGIAGAVARAEDPR